MSQTIIAARLPTRRLPGHSLPAHSLPAHSLAERLWHRAIRSFQAFAQEAMAAQRLIRERELLADLNDAELKDIGLTRADVWAELRKPLRQR